MLYSENKRTPFKNIIEKYEQLKNDRLEWVPIWNRLATFTRLEKKENNLFYKETQGKQEDLQVFDTTAITSVSRVTDSLYGIVWGTGEDVFKLKPSRQLQELIQSNLAVQDWFDYASTVVLEAKNHYRAGWSISLKEALYDGVSFGTFGVGGFANKSFEEGRDSNPIKYASYGVDKSCIDEGDTGMIEYHYCAESMRISKIVRTFCFKNGEFDQEAFDRLPKNWQKAYTSNKMNDRFDIVLGIVPNEDFVMDKKGKKGSRYIGVWFDDKSHKDISEEYYKEFPIPMSRLKKIKGQVYGRSDLMDTLSNIQMLNSVQEDLAVIVETMAHPTFGVFEGALGSDNVLDLSPQSVMTFNEVSGQPIFKVSDVQDPTAVATLLVPKLQDEITAAAKSDLLLDFNSQKQMTAQETMTRFSIRSKALNGMLSQIKNELIEPSIRNDISLLIDMGLLGADPRDREVVDELAKRGLQNRVIPAEVIEFIEAGKNWFTIEFTNELARMGKANQIDGINMQLQIVGASAQLNPNSLAITNFDRIIRKSNNILNNDSEFVFDEATVEEKRINQAQLDGASAGLEAENLAADTNQKNANARKAQNESTTNR